MSEERTKSARKKEREREGRTDKGNEGRADALAGVSSSNGYKWQLENC